MSVEVAIDQPVLVAVRKAVLDLEDLNLRPAWIILGDDERFRLSVEVRGMVSLDTMRNRLEGEVQELFGCHVAYYAVPHHLEVLPQLESKHVDS